MKLGIYGNCQASGFAASIEAMFPEAELHVYRLNEAIKANDDELSQQVAKFSQCDIIFYQPSLGGQRAPLTQEGFAAVCDRLIAYPHIAFRGLQPDCDVVRANGAPIQGPMGPYHSALIAACALERVSEERTTMLFNAYSYARLNYLRRAHTKEVLVRDSAALGYDFSDFLAGAHGRFMNTINHPAINIIFDSARQALARAGLPAAPDAPMPDDNLARSYVWPVYPEIGRAFGIVEDMRFVATRKRLPLEEFIGESFRAYAPHRDLLQSPQIEAVRSFLRKELGSLRGAPG